MLAAVFALALAVRLAYLFEIRDLPTLHQLVMDAQRYDALARDILDRGWRPREPFYQAPLYPYLLAAMYAVSGRSPAAVRLAQALLDALTAVLAAVAAGRLWERPGGAGAGAPARQGHDQAGRARVERDSAEWTERDPAAPAESAPAARATAAAAAAGVLAALYAPAVFYTPLLLKTVPALFLESAALVLLLPPRGRGVSAARAMAAGAALGGAALLQESLLLLAPAAAVFLWAAGGDGRRRAPGGETHAGNAAGRGSPRRRRRRWPAGAGAAAALLAGAALALAPAALLNYAAGGELLLTSSQGGMNFYIGNARGATGSYVPLSSGSQAPERQRADAQRLAAAFAARERGRPVPPAELHPGAVSSLFWREARREIAADPAAWLRLMLRKLRLFWNAYEVPDAEGFRVYRRESRLLRWDPVTFGVLAPLAAVGLLALARGGPAERRRALLLALLAVATCGAVVLFFVFGRYRLAVVPWLLPLAAAGALELAAVARTRGQATGWRGAARPAMDLALLAGAGLAVGLPSWPAAEIRRQDAVIEYNLGTAASRWSEAAFSDYRRLAAGTPGAAPSPAARASLAQAVARATRAAAYLDEAAKDGPGFLAAELEWAIAGERRGAYLAAAGGYAQAAADYEAARQRLAAALTAGAAGAAGPAGTGGAGGAGGADPALERAARRVLAALDAGTVAALNNLGVQLIAAGRLDRAEETLVRAIVLAPGQPGPRGSLALCRFQRGLAARRSGDAPAAAHWLAASREDYRQAVRLAEAAGRADLADLYRRGLAAVTAALTP